ncbi:hypothetical protein [uncultured Ruegeria sp.]|uniref:hypothetical protein n=1 Tax=uncultured Ruegeria sp. TaxID=259304 RepID=UPI00262D8F74|nr:hypothetical protein [uncultured Ruegeria sp.]
MSQKPAFKFKIWLITATIWDNDGFFSVDISRSHKNAEGDWRTTCSFSHNDLLNVAKCAECAENWVSRKQAAASQ